MQKLFLVISLFMTSILVNAQEIILPLWEGTPPLQTDMVLEEKSVEEGIIRISNVQIPQIEVFLPSKQTNEDWTGSDNFPRWRVWNFGL